MSLYRLEYCVRCDKERPYGTICTNVTADDCPYKRRAPSQPDRQTLIDEIFAVRVRNNVPWKRLMEIAFRHAPDETIAALREINENDQAVSRLVGELVK